MFEPMHLKALAGLVATGIILGDCMAADIDADRKTVHDLDVEYQAAVERGDAATMARIHHPAMTLVLSNGTVVPGSQIEQRAREKAVKYEQQVAVEDSRAVRLLNDTAIVTAKLWLKGTRPNGEAFDYKLWYSDTYVRTSTGWRYFFGQAGAPLPQ